MAAVAQAGTTTAVGDDINSAAQQNAAKTGVNIEQKAKVSKATVKEVNAAVAAAAKPVDTKKPRKRKVVIGKSGKIFTLGQLLLYLFLGWCILLLVFLAWWRPAFHLTTGATTLGVLVGMVYSWMYYQNAKRKDELQQLLSMDPGLKGVQYLLGAVPSWISLTDREKMEWLNKLLVELWPYFDRAVCQTVKDVVEPIMDAYRPVGLIQKIFFQELTFGDAPFRVEGIAVKDSLGEIDMEVDVRWCGDANITLGIELPVGGEFTRLNPKVTDIVFVATIKIILKPLVDKIPGFAAAAVALKSPPTVKYRLDFGKAFGSSFTAAPIVAFVNFIIREVIVGMLLWPNRITVPLLSEGGIMPLGDPEIDLEVERLNGRQRGVIKVVVIQAKDLRSYDTLTGKSDPLVEIFTTNDYKANTRHISRNLNPVWDETFFLPVLEKDQILRLEVFDHDAINLTQGVSWQVWKTVTNMIGAKEFMGRSAIPLAPFIADEGLEEEMWFALGKGEWTNLDGPGKGEGMIKLGLQYRATENIAGEEIATATKGLLLVAVIRANNLSSHDNLVTSYVSVKVGSTTHKTDKIIGNPNPRWLTNNKFTFYDVTLRDDIRVTVTEPGTVMSEELGHVTIDVPTVVEHKQVSRWTKKPQVGYLYNTYELAEGDAASITLEFEFLPYWPPGAG
eukprot:jgi/Chrzof1/14414/Cz09g02020.t1